jgi:hypothetical protein
MKRKKNQRRSAKTKTHNQQKRHEKKKKRGHRTLDSAVTDAKVKLAMRGFAFCLVCRCWGLVWEKEFTVLLFSQKKSIHTEQKQ